MFGKRSQDAFTKTIQADLSDPAQSKTLIERAA
jgi:hypothetical protein